MVLQLKGLKEKIASGLVGIMLITSLTGCGLLPKEEEILAPPLVIPEQISYQTVLPTVGDIEETITGTAYFVPIINHNYFFDSNGGRFSNFEVKSGDEVTVGSPLAQMLTTGLDVQIEKQTLLVDTIEKTYGYMTKTAGIEMENAKALLADLIAKKASSNDISLQQIKVDRLKLDSEYQLSMKKNELEQAQIQLKELKAQLQNSVIKSEIDGVVTFVADIREGDYLDTYKTIVSVADPNVLQLEYTGQEASELKIGMDVELTYAGSVLKGKVVFVPTMAPEAQAEQYKNTVRFEVEALPDTVIAGQNATFKVVLNSAKGTIIVPRRALKKYNGKDIIYTLEDGLRVENYVEIGVQSVGEVEILQGIKPDIQIIVE